MTKYWLRGGYSCVVFIVFIVSAELASRLDDWVHWKLPIFSNPTLQSELLIWNGHGWQGKPNGRFKQFSLNEFGFRSRPIRKRADPGTIRIAILGSSETFGQRESAGKEYPAQLSSMLSNQTNPRYEVINAALPGMTVKSMINYWDNWISIFEPHYVFIYPATHLYLGDTVVRSTGQTDNALDPKQAIPFESRFYSRLRNNLPDSYKKWRNRQIIKSLIANKPETWYIKSLPEDRLTYLIQDLQLLINNIQSDGRKPILLTHTISSSTPYRIEDLNYLEAIRPFIPRSTPESLLAFEQEANRRILRLGHHCHIPVLNIAQTMNGRRELFVDLVHFNDQGAEVLALIIKDWLLTYK